MANTKSKEDKKRIKKYFSKLENILKRVKKENKPTRDIIYHKCDNYGIDGSLYLKF